jgi:pimeloyl-ACP methyl ester carboxylesterase
MGAGRTAPMGAGRTSLMPTVHVNGIDIYYERAGRGPPVLFLNGSGTTLATMAPLIDVMARRLEVVAHDQRGLGRTSIPVGPYTMAQYAADALGLLDELRWATCRVVGVSFGGMVAQELAVTAPARVERLALACTSPGGDGGASYPLHELVGLAPRRRAEVSRQLLDSRFTEEWLESHPRDRMLVETRAQRGEGVSDEARRGEVEQLEARRHHDVWSRLGHITCPTFVAAGRFDGIAPVANSEAIVSRVPDATLHVYEGGHAFFAQDRRALPQIIDFLAS